MVELAIGVAAFLFLCWVALQGISLLGAIFEALGENKEVRYMVIGLIVCLLLRWIL
jgi:hypothetical protein